MNRLKVITKQKDDQHIELDIEILSESLSKIQNEIIVIESRIERLQERKQNLLNHLNTDE